MSKAVQQRALELGRDVVLVDVQNTASLVQMLGDHGSTTEAIFWFDHPATGSELPQPSEQENPYLSVLPLIQAIQRQVDIEVNVYLTTQSCQYVNGVIGQPDSSTVWGLMKSADYELSQKVMLIDLDTSESVDTQVNQLFSLVHRSENWLAVRDSELFTQILSPMYQHDIDLESEDEPTLFKKDSSYLITGGLSGLGLETARWMAVHGAWRGCLSGAFCSY